MIRLMNQKGFATIIFILIILFLSIGIIGSSLYIKQTNPQINQTINGLLFKQTKPITNNNLTIAEANKAVKQKNSVIESIDKFNKLKSVQIDIDTTASTRFTSSSGSAIKTDAIHQTYTGEISFENKSVNGHSKMITGQQILEVNTIMLKDGTNYLKSPNLSTEWIILDQKDSSLSAKITNVTGQNSSDQIRNSFNEFNAENIEQLADEDIDGIKALKFKVGVNKNVFLEQLKINTSNNLILYNLNNTDITSIVWIEKDTNMLIKSQLEAKNIEIINKITNTEMGLSDTFVTTKYSKFNQEFSFEKPEKFITTKELFYP